MNLLLLSFDHQITFILILFNVFKSKYLIFRILFDLIIYFLLIFRHWITKQDLLNIQHLLIYLKLFFLLLLHIFIFIIKTRLFIVYIILRFTEYLKSFEFLILFFLLIFIHHIFDILHAWNWTFFPWSIRLIFFIFFNILWFITVATHIITAWRNKILNFQVAIKT